MWPRRQSSCGERGGRPFAGLAKLLCIANPAAMSRTDPSQVIYLGRVDFRNDRRIFGILPEDRFSHLYCLGKTGTGKSTLLENMARKIWSMEMVSPSSIRTVSWLIALLLVSAGQYASTQDRYKRTYDRGFGGHRRSFHQGRSYLGKCAGTTDRRRERTELD
jgi:hypothetical protein